MALPTEATIRINIAPDEPGDIADGTLLTAAGAALSGASLPIPPKKDRWANRSTLSAQWTIATADADQRARDLYDALDAIDGSSVTHCRITLL